uniref:Expansin-like EG45 domain-containing protein n=1 Tax=Globisporangium ultimum (strain ATCC 200006 / CBS 805.95 / DAOM BR144) TaxID=431595 RepID=K3X0R1_GLOUD
MVMNSALLGSLAVLALAVVAPARAQSFTGDGTAYTLGAVSQGNCNFQASATDTATNYAAINQAQWDNLQNCGRCAQVSCVDDACPDKSVSEIVHIVDRCPECKQGDLDLSPTVFKKITGSSPSRLKISWKFVDCPNPGKLQYCLKSGSNPYFVAIQPANAGSGIASMKINGQSTTMVDSAFYYVLQSTAPVDLSAVKVSLTSTSGATVDETVSLSVGSCTAGKSQFGSSSGTPPATTPKATPAPATTPKATPAPMMTPKATPAPATKTPKPTKTPKATKNSNVANESTDAPTEATTAPAPASDEYDDASSGSASAAPTTEAPVTDVPASSGEGSSESPAYDDETPAPASDDEYGSSSASAEPMTPAPASDDEYSGSASAAPAASASSSGDAPAPSAAEGSGAVTTPTETPVVTPKKTTKPSNCKVGGEGGSKTKKTKAEKKAAKDAKKAAKDAKKAAKATKAAKKAGKKQQSSKSEKKTSAGAATQSESVNSTASSY